MSENAVRRSRLHGGYTMKRAMKELGNRAIDRRTGVGKALEQWRGELVSDLGGPSEVSTQQKALVDLAVRSKLLLDSLDAWLLEQPSLVNARKRSVIPALTQKTQLSDALARYLTALSLQRKIRPVNSLAALLAGSPPEAKEGSPMRE